jgi:hypothetical protein
MLLSKLSKKLTAMPQPDNLFLMDNKRRIKIGDFGLCLPAKEWDEEEGDRCR